MRLVTLDLGQYSVKAVELDIKFGRFEVRETYERRLQNSETAADCAGSIMASLSRKPDKILLLVRTKYTTYRNLTFPTKDKKAIANSVQFELDDELPYSLENAAYGFSVLSTSSSGSRIHAAAMPKRHLELQLSALESVGISPDFVTTEAWVLRSFFNKYNVIHDPSHSKHEEPICYLHLGHERTLVYVHYKSLPILCREIPWGGRDLTFALSQLLQTPLSDAEEIKHSKLMFPHAFESESNIQLTSELLEMSDLLIQEFRKILVDLKQIDLTVKALTGMRIGQLTLGGGTSLVTGVELFFAEELGIPVKHLKGLTALSKSGISFSGQTDALFTTAFAGGLSVVGQEKSSLINFRTATFAKRSGKMLIQWSLVRPYVASLAIIFTVSITSLAIQKTLYESKLEKLSDRVEKNLKSFFAGTSMSQIRTLAGDIELTRSRIQKEITRAKDLAKLSEPNTRSPIFLIKKLSSEIPKSAKIEFENFESGVGPDVSYQKDDPGSVRIKVVVEDIKVLDTVEPIVKKYVDDLQKGATSEIEPVTSDDPKRFRIEFTGKPNIISLSAVTKN